MSFGKGFNFKGRKEPEPGPEPWKNFRNPEPEPRQNGTIPQHWFQEVNGKIYTVHFHIGFGSKSNSMRNVAYPVCQRILADPDTRHRLGQIICGTVLSTPEVSRLLSCGLNKLVFLLRWSA
jgi:hypothetical protein